MVIDILLFILSLFLLCIGAYLFVKGSSGLARKLHIPKLIVERLASGAHLFWSMNHQLSVYACLRRRISKNIYIKIIIYIIINGLVDVFLCVF